MREYHVDSNEKFSLFLLSLSIYCNLQLRPTIIVSQDKSIFKQHLFSWQCWFGPNGEDKLVLKIDWYTQMVLAFVSRSFGVRLRIDEEDLVKINEQWRSEMWGHYIEKKAAIVIYGKKNQR